MIELIIYNYLKAVLSVDVFMERSEKAPTGRYVIIEKIGSAKNNHIKQATIAFQSYADTLFGAAELNENVKTAVEQAVSLDEISGVTLNSDYNFTNAAGKQYRYQAVFVFTHY